MIILSLIFLNRLGLRSLPTGIVPTRKVVAVLTSAGTLAEARMIWIPWMMKTPPESLVLSGVRRWMW